MSDMEWEEVDPIVKTVPFAKAWVTVNKDGKPRLNITLSEATLNDVGRDPKANVQIGAKDGQALVRITFGKDGKFSIKSLELGGARIRDIPAKAPIPDGARDTEPCEVEKKAKGELILILPLKEWQAQLNQPVVRTPPPPPRPAPQELTKPVNAAAYLQQKGHKCSRLAGDWWQLDGQRTPRADILTKVNSYRRMAELKPLGLDQIE